MGEKSSADGETPGVLEFRLEKVTSDTIPLLLPLVREYFAYDRLHYDPGTESAILELVEDPSLGAYFLVRSGESILGYCALTYGFDAEMGGRIAAVTDLFLNSSARGVGIGKKVVQALAELAREKGLRQLQLFVIDGNDRARKLYERGGFQAVEGRTLMTLDLTASAKRQISIRASEDAL